ncbi:lipoate--protein ligase family protein [Nocardioides psychrotolerans]|uniref:lipoate--protein ligase family protein n=1 Tax=Nocardioides psychrotolerans TaxID=1005945 RepID=UPI001160128F|nr:lipoate--protein ligase family protein [Nocardioides psychrotolerans]
MTVLRRPAPVTGSEDLRGVLASASQQPGTARPVLLVSRCAPTAAFSRRDTLLPGYPAAAEVVAARGFEPVVRPVGGHLAGYDEGCLVLHLWGSHPHPRLGLRDRFSLVSQALSGALTVLGVPELRIGAVPGEYCDGAWSVNVGGRAKLAGTGQRLFRDGYLFCAVLSVAHPEPVRHMLTAAYAALGLPLDPVTVGSVDQWVPGITLDQAAAVVASHLGRLLDPLTGHEGSRDDSLTLVPVR